MEEFLLHGFIGLAGLSGLVALGARSAAVAGAAVVGCLFALSGVCMMVDAHFLAVLVLIAHAGSLLLILGLVNRMAPLLGEPRSKGGLVYGLAALGLVGIIAISVFGVLREDGIESGSRYGIHTIEAIGVMLVTSSHFLPLLVTTGLLLVSAGGGIALARRAADGPS